MGYKIRAGMAIAGLILSWGFGLNFLSGIAGSLDTAGNILVDIADGIGLVSKGIEAMESYIDPVAVTEVPTITTATTTTTTTATTITTTDPSPQTEAKPVLCKKGRCIPYDPNKDKTLQQQLIQKERERILNNAATAINGKQKRFYDDDEEEEEQDTIRRKIKKEQPSEKVADISPSPSKTSIPVQSERISSWRSGSKKLLQNTSTLCNKISTLLLKIVTKIFPWNRRAKRRLSGEESDEL